MRAYFLSRKFYKSKKCSLIFFFFAGNVLKLVQKKFSGGRGWSAYRFGKKIPISFTKKLFLTSSIVYFSKMKAMDKKVDQEILLL